MRKDPARAIFLITCISVLVVSSFLYGIYSAGARTLPYLLVMYVKKSVLQVAEPLFSDPMTVSHAFDGSGLVHETSFDDPGYLLLAAYFPDERAAGVDLVRLADGHVIHSWRPDGHLIRERSEFSGIYTPSRFQPKSPVLMPDGGLVFIDHEGPLVRIDACSEIMWILDGHFHHSVERTLDGNLLVPAVAEPLAISDGIRLRDDVVAEVSLDGHVVRTVSVANLLDRSGYRGLLLGVGSFTDDPIHLNDVQVATQSSRNWQRGDWLLSLRNLSAVVLYRPSSDELIWLEQGPWLRQHDPNFLADGWISVFGNDVIDLPGYHFVLYSGTSQLYMFDPESHEVVTPYEKPFRREIIHSETQGRSTVLDNGDLFVEETDRGRLMRLNHDGVVWRYNNVAGDEAGLLNWSRYLSETDVQEIPLQAACGAVSAEK